MKTHLLWTMIAGIMCILLCYMGCKKDSGPTSDGTTTPSGSGSDFFPLAENQTFIGKATGQSISYDYVGNIIQNQSINQQEYRGWMGTATTMIGYRAYPLFALNANGTSSSSSKSFLAQSNQSILGLQIHDSYQSTLIPSVINIGTSWAIDPQTNLQIMESKSSYTNSTGKTYSNVIKVNGLYFDSTSNGGGWILFVYFC